MLGEAELPGEGGLASRQSVVCSVTAGLLAAGLQWAAMGCDMLGCVAPVLPAEMNASVDVLTSYCMSLSLRAPMSKRRVVHRDSGSWEVPVACWLTFCEWLGNVMK